MFILNLFMLGVRNADAEVTGTVDLFRRRPIWGDDLECCLVPGSGIRWQISRLLEHTLSDTTSNIISSRFCSFVPGLNGF